MRIFSKGTQTSDFSSRSRHREANLIGTGSWGDFSFSLSENPSVTRFAIDLVFTLSSLSHFAFQFASLLFVFLIVASIIFRLRVASIFVTHVTRTQKPLQSDSQGSKITRVYSQWSKQPVERSHDVTSGQLPVLSDV